MAFLLLRTFPCSEAGVEIAFSKLGLVFGDHRRSIQDNLIETLLMVRLPGIPNVPRSSQVLDNIDRILSARGTLTCRTMSAVVVFRSYAVVAPTGRLPNRSHSLCRRMDGHCDSLHRPGEFTDTKPLPRFGEPISPR
jgi:hypothetical protein